MIFEYYVGNNISLWQGMATYGFPLDQTCRCEALAAFGGICTPISQWGVVAVVAPSSPLPFHL